jgi:hypothetical protein
VKANDGELIGTSSSWPDNGCLRAQQANYVLMIFLEFQLIKYLTEYNSTRRLGAGCDVNEDIWLFRHEYWPVNGQVCRHKSALRGEESSRKDGEAQSATAFLRLSLRLCAVAREISLPIAPSWSSFNQDLGCQQSCWSRRAGDAHRCPSLLRCLLFQSAMFESALAFGVTGDDVTVAK